MSGAESLEIEDESQEMLSRQIRKKFWLIHRGMLLISFIVPAFAIIAFPVRSALYELKSFPYLFYSFANLDPISPNI
jgi:hypothetical protein